MLGELYRRVGQYEKAEESYRTAASLGASPDIMVKYAELLVQLRRFDDSEKVLRRVSPPGPAVDRGLGKLYNAEGQYARAESFLRRAIASEPGDADAHFALATCLQHLGRDKAAQQEYAAAQQLKEAATESTRLLRQTLVPVNSSE